MLCLLLLAGITSAKILFPNELTPQAQCTMHSGQDCYGNDMRSVPLDSPQLCCNECSADGSCGGFAWKQGICYMKYSCSSFSPDGQVTAGTTGGGPPVPPTPSSGAKYCPDPKNDFFEEVEGPPGTVTWGDSGWHIQGQRRVSSKASFNMAGGFVEFDMDLSNAHGGVNTNFYFTFPHQKNCGINCYCDSGATGGCAEMDITENNGGCYQQTTWHTDPAGNEKGGHGGGSNGIGNKIHVKASWGSDGSLTVQVGDNYYHGDGMLDEMNSYGAVFYSSQWVGWVPGNCGGDGNLSASSYTISNLKISGTVKNGPEPRKCGSPNPPGPTPPPSPPSPASTCSTQDGHNNMGTNMSTQPQIVGSYGECCQACLSQQSSGCVGYTWVKDNQQCWLKSAIESGHSDQHVVSGSVGNTPVPPTPPSGDVYCPSANDLTAAYGSPNLYNQGWSISGGAGAATKAAYNLLGGYVEFDIDVSGVQQGVNSNIYSISPSNIGGGYTGDNYCDGAENDKPWCVEMDWIESNGNCGAAATVHTKPGPGNDGCTAWGCRNVWNYGGHSKYHVKVEYGNDGSMVLTHDGGRVDVNNLNPRPNSGSWAKVADQYRQFGAVVYSSQWTGWVPDIGGCSSGGGDLNGSHFSISNLRIKGTIVQGPQATKCT